ncbi:hypothetical protein OG467_51785 (plasmid) [Streptomyces sp. NBC_01361]|nr:hypothetical protein [Streptomyces sp. NBC_01361]
MGPTRTRVQIASVIVEELGALNAATDDPCDFHDLAEIAQLAGLLAVVADRLPGAIRQTSTGLSSLAQRGIIDVHVDQRVPRDIEAAQLHLRLGRDTLVQGAENLLNAVKTLNTAAKQPSAGSDEGQPGALLSDAAAAVQGAQDVRPDAGDGIDIGAAAEGDQLGDAVEAEAAGLGAQLIGPHTARLAHAQFVRGQRLVERHDAVGRGEDQNRAGIPGKGVCGPPAHLVERSDIEVRGRDGDGRGELGRAARHHNDEAVADGIGGGLQDGALRMEAGRARRGRRRARARDQAAKASRLR